MAPEAVKGKKRKSAADSSPKPKKQKKTDDAAAAPKKSTKATKAAVEPVDSLASVAKTTRKQTEDFFSDNEATVDQPKVKKSKKKSKAVPINGDDNDAADKSAHDPEPKKSKKATKKGKDSTVDAPISEAPKEKAKKGKKEKHADNIEDPVGDDKVAAEEEAPGVPNAKKSKKEKKSKQPVEAPEEEPKAAVEEGAEDEEDLDDQTAALLAGFESDRDESDLEVEEEDFDEKALPQLGKKKRNELERARKDAEPGVIYLGRIPHGFFEPQMKKYFSQFGTVTRLRLSRNKKTGASKHYAFIEFANADVADIVAKTMHNYLMFGHILQCRTIPAEQVHAELFKGANQRFKVDPRNKKAGSAMARGAERTVWEKRVENEKKRRSNRAKALKDQFDYDFSPPAVKPVEGVPKNALAIEDGVPQQLMIEEKKGAKGHSKTEAETISAEDETVPTQSSKGKKNKKRKSEAAAESKQEPTVVADAAPPKAKKAKDTKAPEDSPVTEKRKAKSGDQEGAKPKKTKKAKP